MLSAQYTHDGRRFSRPKWNELQHKTDAGGTPAIIPVICMHCTRLPNGGPVRPELSCARNEGVISSGIWNPKEPVNAGYSWLPMEFIDQGPLIEWQNKWDLSAVKQRKARKFLASGPLKYAGQSVCYEFR